MAKEALLAVTLATTSVPNAAVNSQFERAAEALGFDGKHANGDKVSEQNALLTIFYLAGYFESHRLWVDINRIGGIKDVAKVFESIYKAVHAAGADQSDLTKFNVTYLRKNLMNTEMLSIADVADLILYEAQHAFGRKEQQERNELIASNWMLQHKQEYFDAAKQLGLIDRIDPMLAVYDVAWIAGASRIGILTRIIDFKNTTTQQNIIIKGAISILSGQRELWANIDGIAPRTLESLLVAEDIDRLEISLNVGEDAERTQEGMRYLSGLASRSGIVLNADVPFIQYKVGDAIPEGRVIGRTYANYATGEVKQLTESLLTQDLMQSQQLLGKIVDTAKDAHHRPNTSTTAKDAADILIDVIVSCADQSCKKLHILFQSNQPYVERQTLATQVAIDQALKDRGLWDQDYRIFVEGIGFGCKQDVPTIHSELGALVAERWKAWGESTRAIECMLFQTRTNNDEIPLYPVANVFRWNAELADSSPSEMSE